VSEAGGTLLTLKVLTPEGAVLQGEVFEVTLPGSEGELGILPQHAALLTRIAPGELAYRAPEGHGTIALGRGVAEVRDDNVTVLVDRAVPEEQCDRAALEARRAKIAADLQDGSLTAERMVALEEELLHVEVQLRVACKGAGPAH
jgi:F-type H+-transporting ATPase subunit epsilon